MLDLRPHDVGLLERPPVPRQYCDPRRPHVVVKTVHDGERAVITISDDGVGIGDDDLAHIFDPYFTTRRAGTGLGLPIAKNIIEGLGGSIVVRSQRDVGTDVRIDLPLRPAGHAA